MYIRVKVFAKSKKEKFIALKNDTFEIHTKEKAENNFANKRVCEIIAKEFDTETNKIKIISGHKRPQKMLEILY